MTQKEAEQNKDLAKSAYGGYAKDSQSAGERVAVEAEQIRNGESPYFITSFKLTTKYSGLSHIFLIHHLQQFYFFRELDWLTGRNQR